MLQHADDLDFTQDIVTATGKSMQLNPILNGVLAGFNRRKRHGRFKWGNQTLEFDRMRFAETVSEMDSDFKATDIHKKKISKNAKLVKGANSGAICRYFQREGGCRRQPCIYTHKCIVCERPSHGAVNCYSLQQAPNQKFVSKVHEIRTKSEERPPNPRTRRARAQ